MSYSKEPEVLAEGSLMISVLLMTPDLISKRLQPAHAAKTRCLPGIAAATPAVSRETPGSQGGFAAGEKEAERVLPLWAIRPLGYLNLPLIGS